MQYWILIHRYYQVLIPAITVIYLFGIEHLKSDNHFQMQNNIPVLMYLYVILCRQVQSSMTYLFRNRAREAGILNCIVRVLITHELVMLTD